jgi:lipid A 4'-phosphatase
MNKKILNVPLFIWLAFIVSSLYFVFFPHIDLAVSGYFYKNGDFIANNTWWGDFLYHSLKPVVTLGALIPFLIWVYNKFARKNVLNLTGKKVAYILLVLALGPGLIVNSLFKEHWGRPRPNQIVQFGGDKTFTPAFVISDQGGHSFSCGHNSGAFFLLALALLATKRRRFWLSLVFVYGILISFVRIAEGGHFFSDTVVSFFVVYIISYALYGVLFKENF